MEERPGAQLNRVPAPALDPAQVPGLITPAPAEAAKAGAVTADKPPAPAEKPADDTKAAPDAGATPDAEADDTSASAEAETDAEADAEQDAAPSDGPSFEAGDHRGGVEIDPTGVRFRLDEESAEFSWPEIGAVEYSTGRFPSRLTVTVHTTERHSYPADVQSGSRSTIKEWTTQLDKVLDAYLPE
ncbi:hypothetical protein [Phaeacidiphilus oryzae]|uniref:hypothetical protein n=1 Tax=Phaeacidiphilus oryzae TaxID=348818 RepID=UPI000562A927|nr:hypothetical protein [Phaeacidiphilus oryzae]